MTIITVLPIGKEIDIINIIIIRHPVMPLPTGATCTVTTSCSNPLYASLPPPTNIPSQIYLQHYLKL